MSPMGKVQHLDSDWTRTWREQIRVTWWCICRYVNMWDKIAIICDLLMNWYMLWILLIKGKYSNCNRHLIEFINYLCLNWTEMNSIVQNLFSLMGLKGNEDASKILSNDAACPICDQVLYKRYNWISIQRFLALLCLPLYSNLTSLAQQNFEKVTQLSYRDTT